MNDEGLRQFLVHMQYILVSTRKHLIVKSSSLYPLINASSCTTKSHLDLGSSRNVQEFNIPVMLTHLKPGLT